MKKLFVLFILSLAMCMFSNMASAQDQPAPTGIQVVLSGDHGNVPRTPVTVPIMGFVVGGNIYLFFSSDLGEIDVTLEESFEGQLLSTVIESSEGGAIIPFSGDAGYYTLTFSVSNGTVYIGTFELY